MNHTGPTYDRNTVSVVSKPEDIINIVGTSRYQSTLNVMSANCNLVFMS